MSSSLTILLWTAASIGFLHTLIGPDHYVPFVALAHARKWPISRTMFVTVICGIGHVLSSVIIGGAGIALGIALSRLSVVEGIRGDIASDALILFGIAYGIWGLWRARKPHGHSHLVGHSHHGEGHSVTFWTLFIVFVLGPCEPLIPLLMFPATQHNWYGVAAVTTVFGLVTVGTMCTIVFLIAKGLSLFKISFMERYMHALAGGIIAFSGISIRLFAL